VGLRKVDKEGREPHRILDVAARGGLRRAWRYAAFSWPKLMEEGRA